MAGPIVNPYAAVDWQTITRLRGVSHQHIGGQGDLDKALAAGCEVIGPSNYVPAQPYMRDKTTSGGTPLFTNVPAGIPWYANSEQRAASDINFHWCALGSTISYPGDLGIPWRTAFAEALSLLTQSDGGGITINHPQTPLLLSSQRLFEMLDYDPRVLGIEVYNHALLTNPASGGFSQAEVDTMLSRWDDLLASGRRCWGFWVHDHYLDPATAAASYPYRGFNVLLVPAVTEAAVLRAYRQGQFYGAMKGTGLILQGVTVADHEVTVTTDSATTISMICDYVRTTKAGPIATFTVPANAVYARFEAENANDKVFTQPLIYRVPPTPVQSPKAKAAQRRKRQVAALRRH